MLPVSFDSGGTGGMVSVRGGLALGFKRGSLEKKRIPFGQRELGQRSARQSKHP